MTGNKQSQIGSSQIWFENFAVAGSRIFPHLVDHVGRSVAAARVVDYIVPAAVVAAATPAASPPNVRRPEGANKPREYRLVSTTFWLSTGNLLNWNPGLESLYRGTRRGQEAVFLTDNAKCHLFETHCSYRPLWRISTTFRGGVEPA